MRLRHAAGNAAPRVYPHDQSAVDGRHRYRHADAAPRRGGGAFRLEPLRAEHRHIASIRLRLPPHDEFERICQIYCEEFDQFRTLAEHRRGLYQKETTWSLAQTKAVDRLCDAFPPAHRAQLRLLIESQTNQFEGPGGMVDNLTAFSRALFGDYRAAMAVIYAGPRQKSDNTQAGDGGKSYGEAVRKRVFDSVAHRTDTYSAVMDLSTITEKGTRAAGSTTTHLKNLDLKRCAQINECKAGAVVNEYMYNKIVPHQDDPEIIRGRELHSRETSYTMTLSSLFFASNSTLEGLFANHGKRAQTIKTKCFLPKAHCDAYDDQNERGVERPRADDIEMQTSFFKINDIGRENVAHRDELLSIETHPVEFALRADLNAILPSRMGWWRSGCTAASGPPSPPPTQGAPTSGPRARDAEPRRRLRLHRRDHRRHFSRPHRGRDARIHAALRRRL